METYNKEGSFEGIVIIIDDYNKSNTTTQRHVQENMKVFLKKNLSNHICSKLQNYMELFSFVLDF